MKKIYIFNIFVTLILHIIIPICIYLIFGFQYEYAPVKEQYVYMAAIILAGVLLASAILIVVFSRNKRNITLQNLYDSKLLGGNTIEIIFIFTLFINIIKIIQTGNFDSILNGAGNGSIIAYLQLFFDIRVVYFCVLIKSYRAKSFGKIFLWSILYVGISLMYSSRSGILWMVFFNAWIVLGVEISSRMKKNILLIICLAVGISPFLFAYSTNSRATERQSAQYMAHKIVARISYDEIAGIELEQYMENKYQKEIFQEKYGLINQLEQCINSIMPGDLFESDVQPNQYWRAVFVGWSLQGCQEHYMSMTSMLPMYLIMKYGFFYGITISILVIVGIYFLISKIKEPVVSSFLAGVIFYTFFQFFDWCYHFRDMFCFVLTFLMIRCLGILTNKIKIRSFRLGRACV